MASMYPDNPFSTDPYAQKKKPSYTSMFTAPQMQPTAQGMYGALPQQGQQMSAIPNLQSAPQAPITTGVMPPQVPQGRTSTDQYRDFYSQYGSAFNQTPDVATRASMLKNLSYDAAIHALRTGGKSQGGVLNNLLNDADSRAALSAIIQAGPKPGELRDSPSVQTVDKFSEEIPYWQEFAKVNANRFFQPDETGAEQSVDTVVRPAMEQQLYTATYDQAKEILKNPDIIVNQTRGVLDRARVIRIASDLVSKGPAPESNLGDAYLPPSLQGGQVPQTTGPDAPLPGGIPTDPGGTTEPMDLNADVFKNLFAPTITSTAMNPAILEQQKALIMQQINEQKEQEIARAQGESATRGLTGGSFEGRRTAQATGKAQLATAQSLTQLALENAQREREDKQAREQQEFQGKQTLASYMFGQAGQEREIGAQQAQQERQYQFTAQQANFDREFQALEAYKNRAFQAGENAKGQYYQNLQDQLNRDHQLKMQAIEQEFQRSMASRARKDANRNAWISGLSGLAGTAIGSMPWGKAAQTGIQATGGTK